MARATGKAEGNALTRFVEPVIRYLKETRAELRKVTWPTRKEAGNLTLIVLITTVAMSLILGFSDFLFGQIMREIVNGNWIGYAGAAAILAAGVGAGVSVAVGEGVDEEVGDDVGEGVAVGAAVGAIVDVNVAVAVCVTVYVAKEEALIEPPSVAPGTCVGKREGSGKGDAALWHAVTAKATSIKESIHTFAWPTVLLVIRYSLEQRSALLPRPAQRRKRHGKHERTPRDGRRAQRGRDPLLRIARTMDSMATAAVIAN